MKRIGVRSSERTADAKIVGGGARLQANALERSGCAGLSAPNDVSTFVLDVAASVVGTGPARIENDPGSFLLNGHDVMQGRV